MISNPIYGKIKNGNQTTNQLLIVIPATTIPIHSLRETHHVIQGWAFAKFLQDFAANRLHHTSQAQHANLGGPMAMGVHKMDGL